MYIHAVENSLHVICDDPSEQTAIYHAHTLVQKTHKLLK